MTCALGELLAPPHYLSGSVNQALLLKSVSFRPALAETSLPPSSLVLYRLLPGNRRGVEILLRVGVPNPPASTPRIDSQGGQSAPNQTYRGTADMRPQGRFWPVWRTQSWGLTRRLTRRLRFY